MSTTSAATSDRAEEKTGRGFGIYVAFLPWVLFTLITQHGTLRAAALAALVAAVAIAVPSLSRGAPSCWSSARSLAFAGFTVVAFTADPSTSAWVARYARAIAASLLALISFASLLVTPFTEQYARESVPRQLWGSARFKAINRRLTLLWAWVFVAMIPSHLIAGAIDTRRANTIFNWVVPVVLVVWAAKRTAAVSDSAAVSPEAQLMTVFFKDDNFQFGVEEALGSSLPPGRRRGRGARDRRAHPRRRCGLVGDGVDDDRRSGLGGRSASR